MVNANVNDAVDEFLKRLDEASVEPGTAIAETSAKEWLETFLLRAFDRMSAAEYHANRVHTLCELLDELRREQHDSMSSSGSPATSSAGTVTSRVWFELRELAYEIDAFLAAVRSSIDFMAQVMARHTDMKNVRSIKKLLDKLKLGKAAPFSMLLNEWQDWILRIREYRDKLTHHRTLRGSVGVSVKAFDGKVSSAVRPLVIPEQVGADHPDTRASRLMAQDAGDGVLETSVVGSMLGEDGNSEVLRHEHSFAALPGYVTVDEFCDRHLASLKAFLVEAVREVQSLNFTLQKVPRNS